MLELMRVCNGGGVRMLWMNGNYPILFLVGYSQDIFRQQIYKSDFSFYENLTVTRFKPFKLRAI